MFGKVDMRTFTISADGNYFMNTKKKTIITEINKNQIILGKYEEALHIVRNQWLPYCVIELLEEKITETKIKIKILENNLENC